MAGLVTGLVTSAYPPERSELERVTELVRSFGKPLGVVAASWLASRSWLGRARLTLSWPALASGGAVAGVPFTVSLLIATIAFSGHELAEAKLGVLAAAIV